MIELDRLGKSFGTVRAVQDVSLVVPEATITVIVGTSGSGKSTLLRMINRLIEPSEGTVRIDGVDIRTLLPHQLRRRIGYVIQSHGLFPHRTVAENVATVPRLLGWERERIAARVEALLTLLDMDPKRFSTRYPHELSGGQQQRVGLARALAAEPRLLLMDEPFGALDPLIRSKAREELRVLQRRLGITVVLVTHDIEEAIGLADRIAVMREGRIVQYGTPKELLRSPTDDFVAAMFGGSERALRLLSCLTVSEAIEPSDRATDAEPCVSSSSTLREALAELLLAGRESLTVRDHRGETVGRVSLGAMLRRLAGGGR